MQNTQMANIHMRRYLISLITSEMQVKTIITSLTNQLFGFLLLNPDQNGGKVKQRSSSVSNPKLWAPTASGWP
jgi:hypothetical protein